jgi:hypothetical protein
MMFRRIRVLSAAVIAALVLPPAVRAQQSDSVTLSSHYWPKFVAGGISSILAHEAAHVLTSMAVGGKPHFGFDTGRPTIYSGIDSHIQPHKQFLFSASGLITQSVIDEAILDVPHRRGRAFERGILAGGLGTTIFYLTIGRTGSVSDIDFIARTHAMTKTQATVVFGSVAAMHMIRISHDHHYANFFARPTADGRVVVGVNVQSR